MKIYFGIFFFVLGSILASFYGVLATRLPEGKSIVKPRSHCLYCNHTLKFYDLIPFLFYLPMEDVDIVKKNYQFMNLYQKYF